MVNGQKRDDDDDDDDVAFRQFTSVMTFSFISVHSMLISLFLIFVNLSLNYLLVPYSAK